MPDKAGVCHRHTKCTVLSGITDICPKGQLGMRGSIGVLENGMKVLLTGMAWVEIHEPFNAVGFFSKSG
jgi:hypothetical protein